MGRPSGLAALLMAVLGANAEAADPSKEVTNRNGSPATLVPAPCPNTNLTFVDDGIATTYQVTGCHEIRSVKPLVEDCRARILNVQESDNFTSLKRRLVQSQEEIPYAAVMPGVSENTKAVMGRMGEIYFMFTVAALNEVLSARGIDLTGPNTLTMSVDSENLSYVHSTFFRAMELIRTSLTKEKVGALLKNDLAFVAQLKPGQKAELEAYIRGEGAALDALREIAKFIDQNCMKPEKLAKGETATNALEGALLGL